MHIQISKIADIWDKYVYKKKAPIVFKFINMAFWILPQYKDKVMLFIIKMNLSSLLSIHRASMRHMYLFK